MPKAKTPKNLSDANNIRQIHSLGLVEAVAVAGAPLVHAAAGARAIVQVRVLILLLAANASATHCGLRVCRIAYYARCDEKRKYEITIGIGIYSSLANIKKYVPNRLRLPEVC